MSNENAQPLGGTAIKPKGWDRSGWESFKYMLYDPDEGTVLTRTPLSWAKIIIFYCIYYSFLAAFWLACLQVFFITIPEDTPRWTLDSSLIGTNPGVGLKPGSSDANIDSSMINIDLKDTSTTPTNKDGEGEKNIDYAARMDKFLEKYADQKGLHECADNSDANKGNCIFTLDQMGPCAVSPYGYVPEGGVVKPCVFLKLNKIFNLVPTPVNKDELDDEKYADMSDSLKEKIRNAEDPDQVFFDCFGRFPADREAVQLNFFPDSQGISLKYFPYTGGNYHSPLLAVQVDASNAVGQLVHLECRAWYEGVVHDKKDKAGLTQFEIFLN